jgi:hypothetical protein
MWRMMPYCARKRTPGPGSKLLWHRRAMIRPEYREHRQWLRGNGWECSMQIGQAYLRMSRDKVCSGDLQLPVRFLLMG